MPPAGRLGDLSRVPADAHGCIACPHPAVGPAIAGSPSVFVNCLPALRVDDPGIHAACCGPNTWTALNGSATVYINGKPAHRKDDDDRHCGGMGQLITGSGNVNIGGPKNASASLALARQLVTAGGSGTAADAELVAQDMARLPPHILIRMQNQGTRVVACRGSVTDYRTELRGVQPRGWPPGSSWDTVPGAYMPDRNEVVVATRGHGTPAGAHVPATGEGHGSANLVIHESMHAVDNNGGRTALSSGPEFSAARSSDGRTLSTYESQPGVAGEQETYAESAARYYGGDPNDATAHPNLHSYWESDPLNPEPVCRQPDPVSR